MQTRLLASTVLCLFFLPILLVLNPAFAQSNESRARVASARTGNKQIAQIVREIDAQNIEKTIRKLVSFGNSLAILYQSNALHHNKSARQVHRALETQISAKHRQIQNRVCGCSHGSSPHPIQNSHLKLRGPVSCLAIDCDLCTRQPR
jgi:hypothetical protein